MKTRIYIYAVMAMLVLCGCPKETYQVKNGSVKGDVFIELKSDLLEKVDLPMDTTLASNDLGFLIAEGKKPCLISDVVLESGGLMDKDILDISIISSTNILNNLNEDLRLDWTNAILNSMNAGFVIDTMFDTFVLDNIDSLNTNGRVNTDNIINDLNRFLVDAQHMKGVEGLSKIVVLLFNDSEFFNTANAIAINHGERHYIFGDAELLLTPMIFLHELGHSFGLTHANDTIDMCGNMYNIMHETNIGCTAGFSARQLALMATKTYIPRTKEFYYPVIEKCACGLRGNEHNKEVEDYLNSIDRNIDDTPLVGDHFSLDKMLDEGPVQQGSMFFDNYKEEYKRYIDLAETEYYASQRLESHMKLRENNLMRWLNHNRESVGLTMVSMADLQLPDSLYMAVREYKDRREAMGMSNCQEDASSCESRLACLNKDFTDLESIQSKNSAIVEELIISNNKNKIIIDSLNTQVRRLLAILEDVDGKVPIQEEIDQVKEVLEKMVRSEVKVTKGSEKNLK